MATLFAWTGALRKRGQLDDIKALVEFADKLESAGIKTIEEGIMTKDLAAVYEGDAKVVNTDDFIDEIAKRI